MNLHILWLVVKWVLIALAAGFIGQFGRHLAKLILERRHQVKLESEQPHLDQAGAYELEKKRIKEQEKLEKKRAKAEVKRAKKAGDNRD